MDQPAVDGWELEGKGKMTQSGAPMSFFEIYILLTIQTSFFKIEFQGNYKSTSFSDRCTFSAPRI
jgi:hypothetical protein